MPRKKHTFKLGENYHINNTHFNKQRIIHTFNDTQKMEKIILSRCFKYEVKLKAFAIMDTHFHLLIEVQKNSNIPKLMMSLERSYAQYYNHKYKRRGQLFTHNYHAKPATTISYVRTIRRYILENPLKKIHRLAIENMLAVNNTPL